MTARRLDTSLELPVGSAAFALYDIDPDAVAALVLSCPAVAGLSGGPFGAAATYLPGRTVPGVQITPGRVEVHVIARHGVLVTQLAEQVRQVLAGQVLGRTVDIVVEDLEDPPTPSSPAPAGTGALSDPTLAPNRGSGIGWVPTAMPPPAGGR